MDGTAAARLLDWDAAARLGARLAGPGPALGGGTREGIRDDFDELVGRAEALVTEFTGLDTLSSTARALVMTRSEWISRNLRGFERVLEPLARRLDRRAADGPLAGVRRKALAVQVGALLAYLGRKVLGQYDLFSPPVHRNVVYFVGPNVVELERRHRFPPRDFRLWLCLHEVTHLIQFAGVPWLREHLTGLVDAYLGSVDLDARRLLEAFRKAREEARRTGGWRELGLLFLLMTPEQRSTFRRMQAVMSLLEGHGNYVMDSLAPGRVREAERMRRILQERHRRLADRVVQRAVGFEAKLRQYDLGERFVAHVVDRAGMEGFNRIWEREEHLPTLQEVRRPGTWVERVALA